MAYLKDYYSFDEVVTRLRVHDSSITCTGDVVDFVRAGKLEALLELNNVKLLPISEGFKSFDFSSSVTNRKKMFRAEQAFGESTYPNFLRVYARWIKRIKSSDEISIYKPIVKGKTLKNLTLAIDTCFEPLSNFHHSKNQISSISEDCSWREFLKHVEDNGTYCGLDVDTPILVSPFIWPVAGDIYSYIPGLPNYDKKHRFIKCHTLGEDWLIVERLYDFPFRLVADCNAINDAINDGKLYITRDSIQSFEEKYLGINHSIDDFPAKKGKPDKQKGIPVQARREAAFSEWLENQEDIKVVKSMMKAEVWKILQGVDAELFSANMKGFFKEQTLIKFNSGRRQRS